MAYVLYAGNHWYGDAADAKPNATTYAGHTLTEKDTGKIFSAYGGAWVDMSYHGGATGYHAAESGESTTHTHAGGSHPDLAAHDTLGLATQAELDTHAAAADPHTGYLTEASHGGVSPAGHHAAFVQADHDSLPNPHHSNVILTHDILTPHNGFPGGTTNFLRADGTFAAPPGGGGIAGAGPAAIH